MADKKQIKNTDIKKADRKKQVLPKTRPAENMKLIKELADDPNVLSYNDSIEERKRKEGTGEELSKSNLFYGDNNNLENEKRLKLIGKIRGEKIIATTKDKLIAKGGSISRQMEMFSEGGLKQEGGSVDPVSGNDVPVGSTKEEVRDDIPARLSEGEFVMPADVVRFHGLDKMMELRDQAKMGLKKMEAMGQMGNADEATLPDDVPFGMDDLDMEDEPKEMAEGGVVQAANGIFMSPNTGIGGYQQSQFANYTPQFTPYVPTQLPTTSYVAPQQQTTPLASQQTLPKFEDVIPAPEGKYDEIIEYENAEGLKLSIPFVNGKPIYPIPAGYKKVDKGLVEPEPAPTAPTATKSTTVTDSGGDSDVRVQTQVEKDRMAKVSAKLARAKQLGYKPANPITSVLGALTPLGMLGVGKTPGTVDGAGNVIGQDGRSYDPITGNVASSGSIFGDVFNTITGKDISRTTADGTPIENTMVSPMTADGMKQYTPSELMNQIREAEKELSVAKAEVTKSQVGQKSMMQQYYDRQPDLSKVTTPAINQPPLRLEPASVSRSIAGLPTDYEERVGKFGMLDADGKDAFKRSREIARGASKDDIITSDFIRGSGEELTKEEAEFLSGARDTITARDPMQSSQSQSFNDNAREDVENHGGSKGIGRNDNGSTYSVNNDGTFTHENGTTVNFTGSDGKPGNPPSDESISGAPSKGTPADQGLGSINTDGDGGQPSDGCVIATHGVSTGGFTLMEKAKAELWCQKTYHGKWYGEAFRKGYKAAGIKEIKAGTAPNVYQEFKDFVAYGRGVKKGWKIGFNYYFRTLQFFFTGLFIK